MRRRAGFTLTEILVSLGIILVLLAITIPAVSLVRESARRTACQSNLRVLFHGFVDYANTYRDYVPRGYEPSRADEAYFPPWSALIAKHAGLKPPFNWSDIASFAPLHCPSHVTQGAVSHFVMNAWVDGVEPAGLTKLNHCKNRATKSLLFETPPLFNKMSFIPDDDIHAEQARFVFQGWQLPPSTQSRVGVDNHGRRKSNVLYVDGHLETMDTTDFVALKNTLEWLR